MSIFQLGFTKVHCLLHHQLFLSFSLDQEQAVHLFADLLRKDPCKVDSIQQLQFCSSSVAEMKKMIFCTENFGIIIRSREGYYRKKKEAVFMLPSQEINRRKFMFRIKCEKIAKRYGVCWVKELLSMWLVLQPKCHPMFFPALRKLYRKRMVSQGNLLWGGLGFWRGQVSTMLKHGLRAILDFFILLFKFYFHFLNNSTETNKW